MARIEETRQRGVILNPQVADQRFRLDREPPPPDLAQFVDGFWILHWDLKAPHRQQVLTHPRINLSFTTGGRARVTGVVRRTFTEEISGVGRAVGLQFRPGGFRPFLKGPVSTLTDRAVDIEEIFGPAARTKAAAIIADPSVPAALERAAALLREAHPEPDPAIDEAVALVETIADDPSILRVARLAEVTALSTRHLQRLFAEYVGVGPKWVIRRTRMQEAAARAATAAQDWSTLAVELGYADQAHFTRDFTTAVGTSPDRYSRLTRDTGPP
jgi:AraC-like DNA-binding protein